MSTTEARSTPAAEAIAGPLAELARFSGWLTRDHVSVAVRADVHALSVAIDGGHDTSLLVLALEKDLGRLPGGDLRTMLRKALGRIRGALVASVLAANREGPS